MITFSKLGEYGRFGNQLFQIASTIGIARDNHMDYAFPNWGYQNLFVNRLPFINPEILNFQTIYEITTGWIRYVLLPNANYDLEGYFQSYKYFEYHTDAIKYYFTFIKNYPNVADFVSIHVRRGDYVNLQHIHPLLNDIYYDNAISLFPSNTKFLIFSDDIEWCRNFFWGDRFIFSIGTNLKADFIAMKNCKHNIIANSSFSWWAAYLNSNPDKIVVAPKNYVIGETTDDRLPKEWLRV